MLDPLAPKAWPEQKEQAGRAEGGRSSAALERNLWGRNPVRELTTREPVRVGGPALPNLFSRKTTCVVRQDHKSRPRVLQDGGGRCGGRGRAGRMDKMNEVILATAGYDHKIHFWEPPSGECRSTLRFSDSQVNCLKITPDKQFLAAAGNPHVRLFEINSQNSSALVSYDGHTTNVTDVGFQKDAKWMYTGSEDGAIKIWDLRAPSCQRNYDVGSAVMTVALHPNQAELISGDVDGKVKVWDLTANKFHEVKTTDGQNHPIQSLSMATNASVLVGANNKGTVFVFTPGGDTKSYVKVHEIKAHDTYLLKCVLSPNVEKLVTTSADKTVKVWDTKTWTHQRTLAQHQRWVWDAVFSADSYYIITASSDQTAKLWDVRNGNCILSYMKHDNAVTCVALNDTTPS